MIFTTLKFRILKYLTPNLLIFIYSYMNSYVLILDSGVGGISILKELIKTYPNENYLYVADNLNAPYGEKTKEELVCIVEELIKSLLKEYKIKLIVFACNTITATTINKIRKTFSIDIVGTEPNVKTLYENKEKGIVLATTATIKSSKVLKQYKSKNIKLVSLKKVAKLLDENFSNREIIVKELKKQLNSFIGTSNVVLGCTHYNFLTEEIKKSLNNENICFYYSTFGVVKRIGEFLEYKNEQKGSCKIITTKKENKLEENLYKALK